MIIHFLEIFEQLTEEEKITRFPLCLRLVVENRADARKKLADYEMYFSGRIYTKVHHIHAHDEVSQPCLSEDLSVDDSILDFNVESKKIQ